MAENGKINIQLEPEHADQLVAMLSGAPALPPDAPAPPPAARTTGPVLGLVPQPAAVEAVRASMPSLQQAPVTTPASFGTAPRSTLGKVGRALGIVGEVAGTAFAPHLMPWVPGTPQYKERVQTYNEALQSEQAKRAGEEAQTGLIGEEAKKIEQMTPAQVALFGSQTGETEQHGRLLKEQADLLHNAVAALSDPNSLPQFEQSLGKMTPDEQAIMGAAFKQAQMTGSFAPLTNGIDRIVQNRSIIGRTHVQHVAGQIDGKLAYANFDPLGGGYYDDQGNRIANFQPLPPYAMTPQTYTTQQVLPGPGGTYQTIVKTDIRQPGVHGGAGQAAGTGAAGALQPLNTHEQTQLDQIQQSDAIAARLRGVLDTINDRQSQLGNKISNWSMNQLYKRGILTNDTQDAFIQLSGLLQALGSMPFATASRNYNWIVQTQQHLSDPNATFAENKQRVDRIVKEIYPDLIRGMFKGKYGKNAERAAEPYGLNGLFNEESTAKGAGPKKPWEKY